jgi:hypothetical protein
MDEITIKTPNPKCRLYCCLIEFIECVDTVSHVVFSTSFLFLLGAWQSHAGRAAVGCGAAAGHAKPFGS